MTPSQYVASEVGGKAETICALLSDIMILKGHIAVLEGILTPKQRAQIKSATTPECRE
jgi:hypothetical protein